MSHSSFVRLRSIVTLGLGAAAMALAAPAWANKDIIYPSASSAGTGNSLTLAADGNVNLGPITPGAAVSFTVTWSIQDRSPQSGQDTVYGTNGRTVNFANAPVTDAGVTPATVSVPIGTPCPVSSATSTCTTTINFTAPTPASGTVNYRARIQADDPGTPANVNIIGRYVNVNFSVTAVSSIATQTEAHGPYCGLLNGTVDLMATLTTTGIPPTGIGSKLITFGLETAPASAVIADIATAVTASPSGIANLNGVSLVGRVVGDYTVKAAFAGDSSYDASHDTATLGISYLFVGFQQPINPEGNSVFGNGRVIPIKIKLADALGNPVTNATPLVWLSKLVEGVGFGTESEAASVSAADTSNYMRYSATDNQYIYNWDLSALTNGTYKVRVDLGDSAACSKGPYEVLITVSKKKG